MTMNMTLSPPQTPGETESQLVIRMKEPWYNSATVETKAFGTYNVQFAASTDGASTRVHIAAFPVVTKKKKDVARRPICNLSGSYETQALAIEAWENGFVVLAYEDNESATIADAVIKALINRRLAVQLKTLPEAE